ncbi:MAG: hypothetical protein QOJ57_3104, partial [Thermoleophilaceae bacterium]|nr:hypothetical protein [Thermoleophilaceae bacterium]
LRALASEDLKEVLDEAVGLVARTLDVEFAAIAEKERRGDAITVRAGVGWGRGVVGRRIESEGGDSLVGYTLQRRAPVIVDDMASDRRFTGSAVARTHGIVSALSVMIESPDEPFGVLSVLSSRRRRFSQSDVGFVQAVANVLASAVERSWAEQRLGEVREVERRRIARALHDEALQELTEAVLLAGGGRSDGLSADAAGQLVSTLKAVSGHLRGAIYDLRLSEEENRAFADRLRALVDVHRGLALDSDVGLEVAGDTAAALRGDRGTEVLRIVGEALTNARRHSGARHIRVVAGGSEPGFWVEVIDDGRGFDAAGDASGGRGLGITGMRERAALLDGDLDIRSSPATGTAVRLSLGRRKRDERRAEATRILLVEDHTAVREAIAGMLAREPGLEVVGQAASLAEARTMLADVDVAVVDLGLPDGYGGDLITELRAANPQGQALVLSASLDPTEIARAIDSGAAATVDKTADFDQVVDAVRRLSVR